MATLQELYDERLRKLERRIEQLMILIAGGEPEYDYDEAADYLKLKKTSVYNLVSARKLQVTRTAGQAAFFSKTELDAYKYGRKSQTIEEVQDKSMNHLMYKH